MAFLFVDMEDWCTLYNSEALYSSFCLLYNSSVAAPTSNFNQQAIVLLLRLMQMDILHQIILYEWELMIISAYFSGTLKGQI